MYIPGHASCVIYRKINYCHSKLPSWCSIYYHLASFYTLYHSTKKCYMFPNHQHVSFGINVAHAFPVMILIINHISRCIFS